MLWEGTVFPKLYIDIVTSLWKSLRHSLKHIFVQRQVKEERREKRNCASLISEKGNRILVQSAIQKPFKILCILYLVFQMPLCLVRIVFTSQPSQRSQK